MRQAMRWARISGSERIVYRMRWRRAVEALAGLLLTTGAAVAQDGPSAARQDELLHLLRQDCGSCHGLTLRGGLGPLSSLPVTGVLEWTIGAKAGQTVVTLRYAVGGYRLGDAAKFAKPAPAKPAPAKPTTPVVSKAKPTPPAAK